MSAFRIPSDKLYKYLFYILLGVIAAIAVFVVYGLLVKFLWNVTIADLFDVSTISFWQAVGLVALAKLFFGFGATSFNGRPSGKRRKRGKQPPTTPPGDDDESFRQYWESEGKAAFEDYLAGRDRDDGSSS